MYYLVNWGKEKEKAWSGTYYSLYKSLSKISNIEVISMHNPIISRCLQKIKFKKLDYELSNIKYNNRKLNRRFSKNDTIFQFSEIINSPNSYIYQDLSVSYIKYSLEKHKDIFRLIGNENTPEKYLNQRFEMQSNYYSLCKGIFTMGKWLKNDLINRCVVSPNKVHHVGGGINVNLNLIQNLPKTNNKILFIGRDFERKGGYIVYEAFKLLKEKKKNAELYVAGPVSNPIRNPESGYFFLGDCSRNKVSELYNMCDIFCMPSYFEAYGLVFIEALTYGLPCIGRDCYEMPYFIEEGKTGLLLKNDDPVELSHHMLNLLNNRQIKENVISKRDWYIKEYSWDTVAKRINSVINDNK